MAQKQRKTVPHPEQLSLAGSTWETERTLARELPQIAFLIAPRPRSARRFAAVRRMLAKILASLVPVLAQQEPETLNDLIH